MDDHQKGRLSSHPERPHARCMYKAADACDGLRNDAIFNARNDATALIAYFWLACY